MSTSSPASPSSEAPPTPAWLAELLGIESATEGSRLELEGERFVLRRGIVRQEAVASEEQDQTSDTFGFKWAKRDTFESKASLDRMRAWLVERYGDVPAAGWWAEYGDRPLLLDAGCGAGMSGLLLFEPLLEKIRYLGVDISKAVDVAAARFAEAERAGGFVQADLNKIPLAEGTVDVIFSEGVLHHTDSTEVALASVARLLKPGGRFLFYVYRRKGPIREYTDDYLRDRIAGLPPAEAWKALEPLTKLGIALGELDVTVEVPEEIELLGIPAGPIPLQRLFYWHVFKAYYDPDLSLDEMNHINYDWFAPRNAHRQSPEEVRAWCEAADLEIERERIEDAGITVIARRRS